MKKWNVETAPNVFEAVDAEAIVLHPSGIVALLRSEHDCVAAYAPGHWISVREEAGE